ncbi:unnamed protein product, partial [Mesorhabditis belari]|uniref:Uncharacterized protein n=1 Tax=Mesorhabditis belari TaxID=2138241 RepID=A0AAF3E9U3_9BILA
MNRAILGLGRQFVAVQKRALHKGVDSTPPLRFMPIPERIGLYFFIAVAFLSYPTSVLLRLDSLRPRADNLLSPEVQAQIDEIRAARRK